MPVLHVPGTILQVTDPRATRLSAPVELTPFWYDDTDLGTDARAIVEADARKFALDGSHRDASASIAYRGTPHLLRRDRILVIYAGDDAAMLEVCAAS